MTPTFRADELSAHVLFVKEPTWLASLGAEVPGLRLDGQRRHWRGWLAGLARGSRGVYRRKTARWTVRESWGRIQDPGLLVWLAAVAGVPKPVVVAAAGELAAGGRPAVVCGRVRAHLPWSLVADRLVEQGVRPRP